ncbi:MAG: hypothetical protein ACOCVF_00300 [bacterium]
MGSITYQILEGLPPFEVTLTPNPNNLSMPQIKDSVGVYSFVNLPPDDYHINIKDATQIVECEIDLYKQIDGDLEITDATIDCTGNTITVGVTGGTSPYEYSIDGGETYTDPVSESTYIFDELDTALTYNVVVRDGNNNIFSWGEISCDMVTVTYVPYYINPLAEGGIEDESEALYEESFSVTLPWGSTYETTGNPSGNTSFLGWSYFEPNTRRGGRSVRYFTRFDKIDHKFTSDTTIYGVFDNTEIGNPYNIRMCYYPSSNPDNTSTENLIYYCEECPEIVVIYADRSDVYDLGLENVTWYKDPALTQLADDGFYKPNNIRGLIPIYYSNSGLPTIIDVCPIGEPEDLYC